MNGSKINKLVRTEPVRKEQGGRRPSKTNKQKQTNKKQKNPGKVAHRREKGALRCLREKGTEKISNQKRKKPQET